MHEQTDGLVETVYYAPGTLDEVLRLLARHGEDAKLLAGGQSLLILLREAMISPRILISLKNIGDLRTISFSPAEGLRIGSMVTEGEIERLRSVQIHYSALAEAAAVVASPQVRNLGTIGGNLCHADPTADPPAALIALGAELHIADTGGVRVVPVETFFRDYMDPNLAASEVLTRIQLPAPAPSSGSSYLKLRLRHVDRALVGVAAWLRLDPQKSIIHDVRIGLSGAGVTPLRAVEAEEALRGAQISDTVLAEAAEAAATNCDPLDDTEASDWYRRAMVRTLVRRVIAVSHDRARAAHSRETPS